jgi:catabolite repression HPr-like protein
VIEEKIIIKLKRGLQARTATLFVQEANRYTSEIFIEKGNRKLNAKSIMGLMSLAISRGMEVTIFTEGSDEREALKLLVTKED